MRTWLVLSMVRVMQALAILYEESITSHINKLFTEDSYSAFCLTTPYLLIFGNQGRFLLFLDEPSIKQPM